MKILSFATIMIDCSNSLRVHVSNTRKYNLTGRSIVSMHFYTINIMATCERLFSDTYIWSVILKSDIMYVLSENTMTLDGNKSNDSTLPSIRTLFREKAKRIFSAKQNQKYKASMSNGKKRRIPYDKILSI